MTLDQIKTVAVLGAGTMGNGIAHVFARSAYKVILRDVEQRFVDRGLESKVKNLDPEIKKARFAERVSGTWLGGLHAGPAMASIVAGLFFFLSVSPKIQR